MDTKKKDILNELMDKVLILYEKIGTMMHNLSENDSSYMKISDDIMTVLNSLMEKSKTMKTLGKN